MKRVPGAQKVTRAIRSVNSELKACLKSNNAFAARRMARGDYVAAEALAAKGKEIQQFQAELKALQTRWRELQRTGSAARRESVTPLWRYYQPILRALVKEGGECRRTDLELPIERLMASTFRAGDRELMARGRERWKVMIQRARKALVAEGWLARSGGASWRITKAGREMAGRPDLQTDIGSPVE